MVETVKLLGGPCDGRLVSIDRSEIGGYLNAAVIDSFDARWYLARDPNEVPNAVPWKSVIYSRARYNFKFPLFIEGIQYQEDPERFSIEAWATEYRHDEITDLIPIVSDKINAYLDMPHPINERHMSETLDLLCALLGNPPIKISPFHTLLPVYERRS